MGWLLQFSLLQCGAGAGCSGLLSLSSPVTLSEVHLGLLWLARQDCPRGQSGAGAGCSGLRSQSSPVALSEACAGLFWVAPPELG